jgi:hypothetical protein
MGEGRKVYRVLMGNPEGKRPLEDRGVDGRVGSEWILGRLAGGCRVDPRGSCKHGDEPAGSGSTELYISRAINHKEIKNKRQSGYCIQVTWDIIT